MTEVVENTVVDERYRVRDRIGSGGMADVYEAEDTHLGRDVAIKLLHRRFSRDQQFVERFRREASAAARLQHPHVVSVYDRGEHDGTYYIAMERLEGRTLKDLIVEEAPIDQRRVVDLGLQIVDAAHFAHEHGVIHRDLKPHNVIVGPRDDVKVTDFGIARAGASEMTETGSIMGTAQYLSPEQAEGHAVTASSDVYSIGIVLYEMLTGRVPFEADSAVTIALKHLTEAPEPPSVHRPDVHPALEAVVMRALAKDPADRYETAADLAADLRAARERIVAGDDGRGTVLPAGAVVPVAGAALYGADAAAAEEDERRRKRWPWLALALLALALMGVGLAALLFTAQATVPKVVGQDVERATTALKRAGFLVQVESRTDPAPEGRVLAQRPGAGREADEGSTITLVASTGPAERTVPSVVGDTERVAVRELTKASFRVETEERPSAEVDKGRAIGTRPPAGTEVEVGERVRLLISSGPREVEVPRVVGLTRSSAESALEAAGLGVSVDRTASDEPEDEVLAQSPDGGETVEEGKTVSIEISTGPDVEAAKKDPVDDPQDADTRATVPGVVGLSPNTATARLRAAGFGVARTYRQVGNESRDGEVISQAPGAGAEREEGSTITIVVGRFEEDSSDGADAEPRPPTDPPRRPGGGARTPVRVAVLAGGRSSEHEISVASGEAVRAGLVEAGHEPIPVEITREGAWLHDGAPVSIEPGRGLLGAEVVFPVLHGPFGEDGTVQGLLEIADVPYVGAGVLASATCMDKLAFKDRMAVAALPQVDYAAVAQGDDAASLERLGLPVFVKPARLGSSVGISKVSAAEELPAALESAFAHDPLVIVEAMSRGLEIECSVMGNDDPVASVPGEISFDGDWYDYEAKYTAGGMELVIPARIDAEAAERVRSLAIEAYRRAGCTGLARADFFVENDGRVLVNELNTMPGFTATSVFAKLFAASGVDYPELADRLVRLALERYEQERRYRF